MNSTSLSDRVLSVALSVEHTTGICLTSVEPTSHGESGAWRVQDLKGNAFILKAHDDPERASQYEYVAVVTGTLRENGYPAPRYIASGICDAGAWQLAEWVRGEPHRPLTHRTLRQRLELVQLHRTRALETNPGWVTEMVNSVLTGCTGYCQPDTLRNHSGRTRQLLYVIQAWANQARGAPASSEDIVHFDFHAGNILVADGAISAVIDWTGATAGDATFDLVTLLFYSWDEALHAGILLDTVRAQTELRVLRLYMAHMILRQVDWSIRFHNASTVELFLDRSERIVRELAAR